MALEQGLSRGHSLRGRLAAIADIYRTNWQTQFASCFEGSIPRAMLPLPGTGLEVIAVAFHEACRAIADFRDCELSETRDLADLTSDGKYHVMSSAQDVAEGVLIMAGFPKEAASDLARMLAGPAFLCVLEGFIDPRAAAWPDSVPDESVDRIT